MDNPVLRLLIAVTVIGFVYNLWVSGLLVAVIWVVASYVGAGIGVGLVTLIDRSPR